MSLQIKRLPHNGTQNAGYTIVAVIPADEVQNGFPVYYVAGHNVARNSFVTWRMNWYPVEVSDKRTEWKISYECGNYAPSNLNEAISDMIRRADRRPAVEAVIRLTQQEIDDLWPVYDINGDDIWYGTDAFRSAIYDLLLEKKKIPAIKVYRDNVQCGLVEAKNAIDAIEKLIPGK